MRCSGSGSTFSSQTALTSSTSHLEPASLLAVQFTPSIMRLLHCTFAASAITVICCACLVAVLKRMFRSECIGGQDVRPGSSALRQTITSLLVAVALAFGATAACLVKLLSKRAWKVAATVCSKWQPLYFFVVSLQKIILRVIVMYHAIGSMSKHGSTCHLHADYENQFHAALFVWDCAILLAGASSICVDLHECTPALRRGAQLLLALCLCIDTFGSYIWGNEMSSLVSLSVSTFELLLDSQITSCITSQFVLSLYFVYVGWRSCHGRGWYYASLMFELDVCGRASLQQIKQSMNESHVTPSSSAMLPTTEAEVASDRLQSEAAGASNSNAMSLLRQRLLQFQQRHESRCRVFVIPCVAVNDSGGRVAQFALARPAFVLSCLRPLQRAADMHPKFYCACILVFLALPSLASAIFLNIQIRGIVSLFLNIATCIAFMGFISSKCYNLDSVAVKQVALSFRFVIFVVLLSQFIALNARRVHLVLNADRASKYNASNTSPWTVFAVSVLAFLFTLCLLLDSCPHLPATTQIIVTVRARHVARLQIHYIQEISPFTFSCRLDGGQYLDTGVSLRCVQW